VTAEKVLVRRPDKRAAGTEFDMKPEGIRVSSTAALLGALRPPASSTQSKTAEIPFFNMVNRMD
jgi:hypothetical protein